MQDIAGKAAFITGGANGIGRSIAESFVRAGASVAIADIDPTAAARTCSELEAEGARAVPVACDVTNPESLARAADEATEALGSIHLLVNNAGAFTAGPLEETVRKDWEWLLEINVLGVVNGLHTFLPRMRAHGQPSHIVNTASVSGHLGLQNLSIYTASKFAVVGLSESLSRELADSAIGVSVLCPGIVRTGLLESSREHRPDRHGGANAAAALDVTSVVQTGTDPAAIGDQVVAGVRAGEFYILTHPELRPAFEARFARIMAAYAS
jgi:NAD(P)-dependent dehydrogenase (short-subunit alcohol dehydrogenase family)